MQYDIVITQEFDSRWHAVVQGWPELEAVAATRDQVLAAIKNRLAEWLRHKEIVRVEVTPPVHTFYGSAEGKTFEEEWPDFGAFRNDPTLDAFFDEIERRRDEYRVSA